MATVVPLPAPPGRPDPFAGIRPGDRVSVFWPGGPRPHEGYCPGGVVVQVTERLVAIRSKAGYCFCVSKNQAAAGAAVAVLKKGGGKG